MFERTVNSQCNKSFSPCQRSSLKLWTYMHVTKWPVRLPEHACICLFDQSDIMDANDMFASGSCLTLCPLGPELLLIACYWQQWSWAHSWWPSSSRHGIGETCLYSVRPQMLQPSLCPCTAVLVIWVTVLLKAALLAFKDLPWQNLHFSAEVHFCSAWV